MLTTIKSAVCDERETCVCTACGSRAMLRSCSRFSEGISVVVSSPRRGASTAIAIARSRSRGNCTVLWCADRWI
jgi:hypothetical protein